MNREREQALIEALGLDIEPPRPRRATVIAFLLGMIAMFFILGVLPYWRLLLQLWNGCVA